MNFEFRNAKKLLPYIVAVLTFIAIALFYCSPILNGKTLNAGDVNNWKGMANEAIEYNKQTGETTWWTNSMFCGMPTFQITGSLPSAKIRNGIENALHIGLDKDKKAAGIIFGYLVGFFLLLICFDINPWLAILGSIAMTLSTYFMLIIPAGHITKACAIGFLSPIIGGIHAIFRKKYLLGSPLIILYGIVGINMHPQMTYYIFLLIGILCIFETYNFLKGKQYKQLCINWGVIIATLLLVFCAKISWMQMNNEYLKETMRGGHSELSHLKDESSSNTGLSFEYATAWSYGIDETFTFLIPNYMGAASGFNIGEKSKLYNDLTNAGISKQSAKQFCKSVPTYWGEKAFTSGPVYMGAIICFLFILGLIIVKGYLKWALFTCTLFSILLAWGHNFMFLSQLFFDYFPMYNKFRAVESILVVAEITIPLIAILAMKEIIDAKDKSIYKKPLLLAGGISIGICTIFLLFGSSLCSFTSTYDESWKPQIGEEIYNMIVSQRADMLQSDARRSLLFIAGALISLWLYITKKIAKAQYIYGIIFVLILMDMFPVNRRFFNDKDFVTKKESERSFSIQPWEEEILKDKSLGYRTLNLTANTFNDSRTSYRLKSIGGYHAAKLRRYQDLIEARISKEMSTILQTIVQTNGFAQPCEGNKIFPVINMLNAKYVVVPTQQNQSVVVKNPYAMGAAWFVNDLKIVDNPDEEMEALSNYDLTRVAITDAEHAALLPAVSKEEENGGQNMIEMTSYQPNHLEYTATCYADKLAVFSEVYYPDGWKLFIDGKETPLSRVNYLLRAAVIPEGTHKIEMSFTPSATNTDKWCVGITILSLLISLSSLGLYIFKGIYTSPSSKQQQSKNSI